MRAKFSELKNDEFSLPLVGTGEFVAFLLDKRSVVSEKRIKAYGFLSK